MDEEIPDVFPSWWGQLPLPPVRPRYVVRKLSGFTGGGAGGRWEYTLRKPRVTWHVYDRLDQGRQVGPEYDSPYTARHARVALERAWEQRIEEMGSRASTQA